MSNFFFLLFKSVGANIIDFFFNNFAERATLIPKLPDEAAHKYLTFLNFLLNTSLKAPLTLKQLVWLFEISIKKIFFPSFFLFFFISILSKYF